MEWRLLWFSLIEKNNKYCDGFLTIHQKNKNKQTNKNIREKDSVVLN